MVIMIVEIWVMNSNVMVRVVLLSSVTMCEICYSKFSDYKQHWVCGIPIEFSPLYVVWLIALEIACFPLHGIFISSQMLPMPRCQSQSRTQALAQLLIGSEHEPCRLTNYKTKVELKLKIVCFSQAIRCLCWGDNSEWCFVLGGITCRDNQFQCDNDRCIPSSYQCDGEEDCGFGDISDERNCKFNPSFIQPSYVNSIIHSIIHSCILMRVLIYVCFFAMLQ